MRRKLTTTLSIMTLVVGVAGLAGGADVDAPEGDVSKTEGEVVMITPAVIHLTIDNRIEEFERTPQSNIEEGLNNGDEVYIWFHERGTSRVVDRATRKEPETRGEPATTTMRGQRDDDTARQQQGEHAMGEQRQRHAEQKSDDDDTMSYAEYQRRAQEQMTQRTTLPQTASNVHGLALAGLLLIATGAALWFRATRS